MGGGEKRGMKYVVFNTRHHDGFCMFDSRNPHEVSKKISIFFYLALDKLDKPLYINVH